MRPFWITVVASLILLIAGAMFIGYAGENIGHMTENIDEAVLSITSENWEESNNLLNNVQQQWSDSRLIFSLFFDAISIGEVEASLLKSISLSKAKEQGSALAELANLRHQLLFLFENETISIENIL